MPSGQSHSLSGQGGLTYRPPKALSMRSGTLEMRVALHFDVRAENKPETAFSDGGRVDLSVH